MAKKKHPRVSILVRIALLFIAAIAISTGITFVISGSYMLDDAAMQAKAIAKVAAVSVETAIGSKEGFYRLEDDEEFRNGVYRTFRFICRNAGIKYLYLYRIQEDDTRRYIICAAEDDEDDLRINQKYGFGGISTTPIHKAEKNVMNGDLDGDYEFIDNEYGDVCMYVIPICDSSNNILALIGVDYSLENITYIAEDNRQLLILQDLIIFGSSFIISIILLKTLVVMPIEGLSRRMREFARDKKVVKANPLGKRFFEDEVTDIEKSFDMMAADISGYVTDIEKLTGEKIQTRTQFEIARKIQFGIVPMHHSLSGKGYDVYGCEYSAKEVGGDFYDVFELDDHRICIAIGDISGKGISAALFMVLVKTALVEKIKAGLSLEEALNTINRDMCVSNPENMFATVFCAVLDTRTGVLRFANGGHNPPVMLCRDPYFIQVKSGMALGLFADADFEEEEITLKTGEGMLIFTDGVTEAVNTDKRQYGEQRLLDNIKEAVNDGDTDISAGRLTDKIIDSVHDFTKGLEQFDDITCVAFTYTNDEKESRGQSVDMTSFNLVKQTILNNLGDSEHTRKIILACEEMYSNIIFYSGADNVRFSCERVGSTYSVTFSDNGVEFDPVKSVMKEKDFEELDSGGMGIRLAKMNSDEMTYSREKNRNVLTMKFKYSQNPVS